MRSPVLILFLLLLAGCQQRPEEPTTTRFLPERDDADLHPYADLLWADLRELNGSVVLIMEFENLSRRIPDFVATFTVETADGENRQFLRTQPNASRPPAYVEYVHGHVLADGTYGSTKQVCAMTEVTEPPWLVRIEAEHRHTGLTGGGSIRDLHIRTGDFEGNDQDEASSGKTFPVEGGTNPYAPECPLLRERPE